MKKALVVFGTRPEAIKMAPVIAALRESGGIETAVCVTAQHRHLLDSVLRLFEITPAYDLDIMKADQSLDELTVGVLAGVGEVFDRARPDVVLVHGDTTTTMAAALGAFYRRIPVGHVEAGLRSRDFQAPWPEELNRRVAALATRFHFAPTAGARSNLLAEGFPEQHIHVTGNTVIDALQWVSNRIETSAQKRENFRRQFDYLDPSRKLIVVTGHRRENFGAGFQSICSAIARLAKRPDVEVVYPVHPNPNVRSVVDKALSGLDRVFLIEPLDYEPFVYLMSRASIMLTDSGGIQEEAPSLGKPVLVLREVTERPEAVVSGTVRLVGSDADRIVGEVERLLDDAAAYGAMSRAINPYGDGHAAERIVAVLEREL
ncbi:MAG TPA: UDP-N-acetylglucosamine 2-epimerase (non-hydrolyzing) [Gemmatimonadaceae bacterium]|nr:UDP-N-acetylglucosamine 2-epimerase (non-hydrolyzing) [Gemmatimonadaceae bacterium]